VIAEQIRQARLADIAELAESVTASYSYGTRTEPEAIIAAKGITLSFGSYADAFDGMLEHKAGRFHIYANLDRLRARDSGRARFTLAHELGHYFIDDHRRALQSGRAPSHPSFADFQSRNPVEYEADHFASNLLMPTERFTKAGKRLLPGFDAVLGLKDTFGTSITSTAIRYTQLDLAPCALVKWNTDGFAWKWFSPSTYSAGIRSTVGTKESVPRDSATGKALAGDAPPSKGFFQCGTSASAWFPGIRLGTPRDLVFIEQAVPLGEFGVLTLLYPEQRHY
jgi:Zn-dependent peptidase ImmA (M78 family)